MTADEMIPDTEDAAHDSRFWCLPPVRDSPSESGHRGGNFPMYLVTQGFKVGVWYNWTAVHAMVDGYPSGSQRGHQTMEGCVREWQLHCPLGVHPHSSDPKAVKPAGGTPRRHTAARNQAEAESLPNLAALDLGGNKAARRPVWSEASASSPSSVSTLSGTSTAHSADSSLSALPQPRYWAIWRGRVVYTSRASAKKTFLAAEAEGLKPRMLATADLEECEAFASGVHWIKD
ncbi:hypothetical protein C8F04DRAFT_1265390 [Mycena alexandri]|uniref:Uncharacterized protein n=1 Tax=Mycena alexandri TaxID=1745969 RepID=A0AAD6SK87_9AGAR|nr:hypothetical protein C8F04DRAFT_1265390 [Mycena alexandri]